MFPVGGMRNSLSDERFLFAAILGTILVVEFNPCRFCRTEIPLGLEPCPHCGQAGPPPNVKAAEGERVALDRCYRAALRDAESRGCAPVVQSFEAAVQGSAAVLGRPLLALDQLACSGRPLYAAYDQRLHGGAHAPPGKSWDRWRRLANAELSPLSERRIRLAVLSLDGLGVRNHGNCFLVFREDVIASEAAVFDEDSPERKRDRRREPAVCQRAAWRDRARLCAAHRAASIDAETTPADFPGLLLKQGATPGEDRFVEVSIWGPLTMGSCERALLVTGGKKPRKAIQEALRRRLAAVGVDLEVR